MSNHNLYQFKVDALWKLRSYLHSEGFIELPTPVVRRYDRHQFSSRLKLENGKYLRDSPAYGLRRNLQFFERVYEIAPCFRPDEPDETHLSEFLMLDLYSLNSNMEDAVVLAHKVLSLFYTGHTKQISVIERIKNQLDIDFYTDPSAERKFSEQLGIKYTPSSFLKLLEVYIKNNIEPQSKGCCLIATDFPDSLEFRAKRIGDTLGVSKRFEFLIDGIEVFHGYEDETDILKLQERANTLGQFEPEETIMAKLLESGNVPIQSAGFGFGIERLCQVCLNEPDIRKFAVSQEFC